MFFVFLNTSFKSGSASDINEEQAVKGEFRNWLILWLVLLIYGSLKCRVRSFHRQNEFSLGNKEKECSVCLSALHGRSYWPASPADEESKRETDGFCLLLCSVNQNKIHAKINF